MNDTLDQHRVLAVLEQKIDGLSRREQTTAALLAQFRVDPFAKNLDHDQIRMAADEEYKRSRLVCRVRNAFTKCFNLAEDEVCISSPNKRFGILIAAV
jgi:hypothetical protein